MGLVALQITNQNMCDSVDGFANYVYHFQQYIQLILWKSVFYQVPFVSLIRFRLLRVLLRKI